jgi:hypothetical protein
VPQNWSSVLVLDKKRYASLFDIAGSMQVFIN